MKMKKATALVDLEGVLFPEMWPAIASAIGEPKLEITTRDVPDYRMLMEQRLRLLRKNNVTLADVQQIVSDLDQLQGAVAFIDALNAIARVVIVTDSFAPMNANALASFSVGGVFTNHFATDRAGFATECFYWHIGQGKERVYEFLPANGPIFAIGDGFNDLEMLRRADLGILFSPSDATRQSAGQLPVLSQLEQVIDQFAAYTMVH